MKIYFVRHGSSEFNEVGKMAGRHDPSLSAQGHQEVAKCSEFLVNVDLSLIYTSPLKRAVQTAEAIASKHNLPLQQRSDLQEIDMGEFSGLTWDEAQSRYSQLFPSKSTGFWELFANDLIPGQEQFNVATRRILSVFNELSSLEESTNVAVIAHKGVLEVFMTATLGFPPQYDWFTIKGGSISIIEMSTNHRTKFHCINYCPDIFPSS